MTDGDYQEEIARLRAEVAALTADNAALLTVLTDVGAEECGACGWNGPAHRPSCPVAAALRKPRPGAALLEQHRKALAAITEERDRMLPAWERLSAIALKQGRSFGGVLDDAENHRAALAAAAAAASRHETTRATMAVREEEHRKALEQARYADDNAKAFTQAFCETAEAAVENAAAPKGGQHVSFHGDFAHVPPSAIARLRWWAACGRAALNGEASRLLVRAKNEGLEKAARAFDDNDMAATAAEIRAMKEPE